jgi:hypothetical protein
VAEITVDPDDLVTLAQVAKELGMASRQVVTNWRLRYRDFPPPVLSNDYYRVYSRRAIFAWCEANGLEVPE